MNLIQFKSSSFLNKNGKKVLLLFLLVASYSAKVAYSYYEGAPPGKSGSVADGGASCASSACHNYPVVIANGWITSNIPTQGYTPDSTYEIYLQANHNNVNVIGFEVTAEDSLGNKAGEITVSDSVRTQIFGLYYITHTEDGVVAVNDTNTWKFNWKAPSQGFGSVIFYGAFNTHDSLGGNKMVESFIQLTQLKVKEVETTGVKEENQSKGFSLYPNPAQDKVYLYTKEQQYDRVIIHNAQGKEMLSLKLNKSHQQINLAHLPAGMYGVILLSKNKPVSNKLLIKE